ncbi:hypothetical protein BC628DRAFT_1364135 [Trametes gibbosa]|nr:hypothetical protein BC628DRAFT_1389925 [Trametes gibbosa]KAI0828124.1 hypothetical protein BC628DRAFT_1364135 [Trametes gibbosa]
MCTSLAVTERVPDCNAHIGNVIELRYVVFIDWDPFARSSAHFCTHTCLSKDIGIIHPQEYLAIEKTYTTLIQLHIFYFTHRSQVPRLASAQSGRDVNTYRMHMLLCPPPIRKEPKDAIPTCPCCVIRSIFVFWCCGGCRKGRWSILSICDE